MEKEEDGKSINLVINGSYIYGYFKKDGSLYKIYQPKTLDKKFIKVKDYIQGSEQINLNKFLLITSSLKDILSIKSLKLKNIDIIAPDSENTLIKHSDMKIYSKNYKKILVMFDNDEAGIAAMLKYKEIFPYIHICYLPMSKDISDSIRDHGALNVRNRLVPIIDKIISLPNESKECKS
jgi:type II secretory pathway component GspD/PulD (secretin)